MSADSARQAMDLMYRHGGSTSFKRESRLAECWRDLQVVGQTVTIASITGRVEDRFASPWLVSMIPSSRYVPLPVWANMRPAPLLTAARSSV